MEECLGLGGAVVVEEGSVKEPKSKTGSTGGGADDGAPAPKRSS
jgi:hypothetical protein